MSRRQAFIFITLFISWSSSATSVSVNKDTILMGVSFSFTAIHGEKHVAQKAIERAVAEVVRIESLISSWDPNSQTSMINNSAGIKPVAVDQELYQLIERSKKVSVLSNGYFDISFSSIHNVWDFKSFKQENIPNENELLKSVELIDYKKIILNKEDKSVFLQAQGMSIGFGAIGKGYAADQVKIVMQEMGITAGVINAGGDLLSWGVKPDGTYWKVGIMDPENDEKSMAWMESKDMAIVTSGNYKKYVEIDGVKYCHIINPKTGWPVKGLSSVTIIAKSAEIADALATTVFVLGKADGLKLINHLNDVECIIVDETKKMTFSQNMNKTKFIGYE